MAAGETERTLTPHRRTMNTEILTAVVARAAEHLPAVLALVNGTLA